jgi:cell division septal protein FtsQ
MIFKPRGETQTTKYSKRPEIISRTQAQKKEKFSLNIRPLNNVFYLALIVFGLYVLFFSDYFKIKNIEVEGVRSVEISDYLHRTLIGKNIVLFQTGSYLRDLIKQFPVLSEADIVRGLPHTIKINVSERDQVLIWCNSSGCFNIDTYGYAYDNVERPPDKIVLIDDGNIEVKEGSRVTTPQFIGFFLDALKQFDASGIKVKEARISETTFKVNFVTVEGWQAILDSSSSLQNQISAVAQVVKNNRADLKEYVDVRVEGAAYIK